jgi:hypothetical protein
MKLLPEDRDISLIGYVWIKLCKFKKIEKPSTREVRSVVKEFQKWELEEKFKELQEE